MQDLLVKKIRENLYSLVDVTTDLPALLKVFKDKEILSEDDVEEIEKIDISFDKKTTFYWAIIKKEDSAFDLLLDTFKSTGNEEGVQILTKEAPVESVEADVTVEATNQEGVDFAEDMEKEFDRIQTQESESEPELQGHGSEDEGKPEIQVTQEFLKSESSEVPVAQEEAQEDLPAVQQEIQEDEADLVESLVRVEVTPPDSPAPHDEEDESPKVEEVVDNVEIKEVEETPEPVEEPKAKQVTFETPKEFVISKDAVDSPKSSDEEIKSGKSIVAQNRELFEKSAPKGVRVTYNFKKDDASASAASQETPENKVANLKNFFQNLGAKGSKDDSSAPVERRGGNKLGGVHPNRRTVAS